MTTKRVTPRTTPRKATTATAPDPDPPVTVTSTDARPVEGPRTAPITFRGHNMIVKVPTTDQLTLIRLFATRMERADAATMTPEQAMDANGRAFRLVQSVLTSDEDKLWVEDLVLSGDATLEDTAEILSMAMAALQEANPEVGNRETRRAAARRAR